MKKLLVALLFVPVLILSAFMVAGAGQTSWMDMENCDICKSLAEEDPALLENMSWEHHDISDGLVSVSTVAPAFMEHFRRAAKRAEEVEGKLREGKEVRLCTMCIEYGSMLMTGKVKVEHVSTSNGYVNLTTSDDPEMVGKIQKWGERTRTALAKMETETETDAVTDTDEEGQ